MVSTCARRSSQTTWPTALERESLDSAVRPTVIRKADVFNGVNEVSLEDEMVEMIRTGLLRDAMVSAYNFKTGQLRTAMKGVVA